MNFELRLPPVLQVLVAGAAMWGIDRVDAVSALTLSFAGCLSAVLLMVLLAWDLYLGSGLSFLVVVAYMTRFQIVPEERFMTQMFGEAYLLYRRSVRRWF